MKARPRHLITALAALAGLSAPSTATMLPFNAAPVASIASSSAMKSAQSPRRHLPFFNYQTPANPYHGGLFKHFKLNQRQRRKFNRQRHAAGIKKSFN
jgi:poly(3-hydroxybutyrate) depolymerase